MAIRSELLTIAGPDGEFSGYFATPSAGGVASVLVIQEIFGVNSHIRSVADRLASAGYAALAPDIFWRVQPGIELGYTPNDIAKGRELKAKMNNDHVVADLGASLKTLAARPECRGRKQGVIGFCYGGLLAYLAAARLQPACASSYYGGGIVDYLSEAVKITQPIQFHFGADDSAIPLDHVGQIRQALKLQPQAEVFVYDHAGHGFHCDQRGSFHDPSAKLAWQRTLALFGKYLH